MKDTKSLEPRRRFYILLASILLHMLLLFFLESAIRLNWIDFGRVPEAPPESEPIVFDLQPPERPREVIETPEDARVVEHQDKARFLSDKNALARNPETDPNLDIDEPFARGVIESHDLPEKQALVSKKEEKPRPEKVVKEEGERESGKESKESPDRKEDMVAYKVPEREPRLPPVPIVQEPRHGVAHDHRDSRAEDMGGLSLNTYDWDFAPYMLVLKKKIQNNVFPPASFYLGMVSGTSLLRFRIYPDGELKYLEVLAYEGAESLMKTSYNAIDALSSVPRLPQDFPAPYLEVTAKFSFTTDREER